MRLFYSNLFSQLAEETWNKIETRLKSSNIKTLNIEQVSTNLIKQHMLDVPVLGDDKEITSFLYLEDSSGRVYEPNQNAQYGSFKVVAVATFRIPYKGDSAFFKIMPTNFTEVGYDIKVINGTLIVKIPTEYVRLELTEQWVNFIKNQITAVKANIQQNLEVLANDVANFEGSLSERIKNYILNKREELEREEKRNNDINPFN